MYFSKKRDNLETDQSKDNESGKARRYAEMVLYFWSVFNLKFAVKIRHVTTENDRDVVVVLNVHKNEENKWRITVYT